jgi:hypothetical protein
MPEKAKDREVFKVFVRSHDHLLVPVRRKQTSMPPREKELIDAGFVVTSEIADVPNARYFWNNAIKVMQRQEIMNVRYVPHPKKKNKNIRAYHMATDFCLEPILAEIGGEEDEIRWLRVVTSSAGRMPKSQKLIDEYMRPKGISTPTSPPAAAVPPPETDATSPATAASAQEKQQPLPGANPNNTIQHPVDP